MAEANPTNPSSAEEQIVLFGPDGKPLLSEEELDRQKALFQPMKDDMKAWEATFTPEEKEAQEKFEASLRISSQEGGDEVREAFEKEMDDAFEASNTSNDGILDKAQFKAFNEAMVKVCTTHGLKKRETTDEFIDMAWAGFNGYQPDRDGVSKEDLLYVLGQVAM